MTSEQLVYLGIFLNGIGTLYYVIATIRGKIKPDKISFLAWSIAPIVAFFAQISQGVGVQAWMTLSVGVFPLSVFFASFINKKAFWKIDTRDIICGVLAVFGLLLWYLTKEANMALVFSLIAEGSAALPTIIKSYYFPQTEKGWPWFISLLCGVLTIMSITTWNFATVAYPVFYTFEMLIVFLLIQFKLGIKK